MKMCNFTQRKVCAMSQTESTLQMSCPTTFYEVKEKVLPKISINVCEGFGEVASASPLYLFFKVEAHFRNWLCFHHHIKHKNYTHSKFT
jgi:hypothetical protein